MRQIRQERKVAAGHHVQGSVRCGEGCRLVTRHTTADNQKEQAQTIHTSNDRPKKSKGAHHPASKGDELELQ